MRLLIDESVRGLVVARLREDGHDVHEVRRLAPGLVDDEVFALAGELDAVLVTADKGFSQLARRATSGPAILMLRLTPLSREERAARVCAALRQPGEVAKSTLVVLGPQSLRSRRLEELSEAD